MKKVLFVVTILALSAVANAMDAGRYEQKLGDGSTDVLIVNKDGTLSLEQTRQVGGPGGISNEGVVSYQTVCRVKEWGNITSENATYVQYQARFAHLTDLTGLSDTKNCSRYEGEFNGRASIGHLSFSIKKSEFSKVK